MKVSIIIPVLNEENFISKLLDYLLEIQNPEFTNEIIVVDCGSEDNTLKILENFPEIKVFNSTKGRAKQMNFGAKNANSEILYFLHCDTFPPKNFDSEIVNQIQNGKFSGCFKMKFDNNHIVLKVSEWFTQFNFQAFRGGDQSLFVEKQLFEKLNGFNENLIIYEDNELIARLYQNSQFTVIQKNVTTSARKYLKNGIWKLQFHFLIIHIKYWLGSSQENLVDYYQKNIK
jgi:rSAM/selenodomain-associated transferase 2